MNVCKANSDFLLYSITNSALLFGESQTKITELGYCGAVWDTARSTRSLSCSLLLQCPLHRRALLSHTVRPDTFGIATSFQSFFLSWHEISTARQQDNMTDHTARTHYFKPYFFHWTTGNSSCFSGYSLESFQEWGCIPVHPPTCHPLPHRHTLRPAEINGHVLYSEDRRPWGRQRIWTTGNDSSTLWRDMELWSHLSVHISFFTFPAPWSSRAAAGHVSPLLPPLLSHLRQTWSQKTWALELLALANSETWRIILLLKACPLS